MKTGKNLRFYGAAVLMIGLVSLGTGQRAMGECGCMDIALVIDDSGSLLGAIDNVKAELPGIIASAQATSGGDLRMGLVSFPGIGLPTDGILVRQELTTDIAAVEAAIQALTAAGGANEPEPSDVALQFAVTGSTTPSPCVVSNAPFGTFRSTCVKIAVLITDAHPGECADTFTNGVSDVYAHNVAVQAASAGVLVSSIYVPTGGENPEIKAIMEDYADVTGGEFVETEPDGIGTGEGIADIIASCGGATTQCVTRNSRFWFTHAFSNDSSETNCASLLRAITANGGFVSLGFLRLPVTFENSDNVIDEFDALMEAVGFYWKSKSLTGEDGNQQSQKLRGSKLCNARKELSVELIAATANVRLLGTRPSNCTYVNGNVVTNFPANLLQLARAVASGNDPVACQSMTALLRKFNNSGVNNNFAGDLVECSPNDTKSLKSIARDPTSQFTCPGLNDNCATAQAIFFQAKNPPFSKAKFTGKASLANFPSGIITAPTAFWKVSPPTAGLNRSFTATASGNFDIILRILSGPCVLVTSNGTTSVDDSGLTTVAIALAGTNPVTRVNFATDGTNDFFIEARPGLLAIPGSLKLTVTSP